MSDGDTITNKQFYETMDKKTKEVLTAVEKVGDKVNGNSIAIAKMDATMKAYNGRIEANESDIRSAKLWNRADSIISGIIAGVLGFLGMDR